MKLRVPHTFALLFGLIVLAAAATHVLPAGEYGRVERGGRRVVEPKDRTKERIKRSPVLNDTSQVRGFVFDVHTGELREVK